MSSSSRKAAGTLEGHVGGSAVLCCIHQRPKREKVALFNSDRPEGTGIDFAHLCPCCENMFILKTPVPYFCSRCTGQPVPPEWELPEGVRV